MKELYNIIGPTVYISLCLGFMALLFFGLFFRDSESIDKDNDGSGCVIVAVIIVIMAFCYTMCHR